MVFGNVKKHLLEKLLYLREKAFASDQQFLTFGKIGISSFLKIFYIWVNWNIGMCKLQYLTYCQSVFPSGLHLHYNNSTLTKFTSHYITSSVCKSGLKGIIKYFCLQYCKCSWYLKVVLKIETQTRHKVILLTFLSLMLDYCVRNMIIGRILCSV